MKIVGKTGGEKATIVTALTVEAGSDTGSRVVMDHVTLHKATDVSYQLRTTFDFAGVKYEDILKLASETLVIRWRTAFKGADKVDDEADHQTVSVAKMLKGNKPRMSKQAKVAKVLADMTPEEKRAFILEHAKAMGIEITMPSDDTTGESNEE
jgi:hypothetical protein